MSTSQRSFRHDIRTPSKIISLKKVDPPKKNPNKKQKNIKTKIKTRQKKKPEQFALVAKAQNFLQLFSDGTHVVQMWWIQIVFSFPFGEVMIKRITDLVATIDVKSPLAQKINQKFYGRFCKYIYVLQF